MCGKRLPSSAPRQHTFGNQGGVYPPRAGNAEGALPIPPWRSGNMPKAGGPQQDRMVRRGVVLTLPSNTHANQTISATKKGARSNARPRP